MSQTTSDDSTSPDSSSAMMTQDFQQTAEDEPNKQLRDVAFAAALLENGRISERQLLRAIRDWSAFGDRSLAQHLAEAGLIQKDDEAKFASYVEESLKKTVAPNPHATPSNLGATTDWTQNADAELLRAASMLGIAHATESASDAAGRQVTMRFTLLRKLGQGGLGSVWLARDESLNRRVAIKEITSRPNLPEATLRRFRREAEITGQLEHPNIVSVYQFGDDAETGQSFYAMRFLGKKTLADAVAEYHERQEAGIDVTMELHQLLTAFLSVCQAIGFAHSKGIIHRDLKPENIALDSYGQVIVIDWGLAKVVGDGEISDSLIGEADGDAGAAEKTVAGQVLGTPLYMAPEQAAGRIDEIDERTDIYGLGAILFSILTGYAPHEKSHASLSSNTKVSELITAIVTEDSPRVRQLNADVDPALAAICAKAMAKRRYARYESASQLADDVQRWSAGERVTAYEEPWTKRLQRWIASHRMLSQILAGTFIVLFVFGITLAFIARQNHLAAMHTEFEEMRSHGRQLEAHLVAEADDLGRQVRFMSTLPPIQGIIEARNGAKDADPEEVWRQRLEKIYTGLLRAHADYLSVSYLGLEKQIGKEIVRVERHTADAAHVRTVPLSRLSSVDNEKLLQEIIALPPGELKWSFQSLTQEKDKRRQIRTLSAFVPVYDDKSGEPFGVVTVEMNLTRVAKDLLVGLKERRSEIFLTDEAGKIWMQSIPEIGIEKISGDLTVATVVPQTKDLFVQRTTQRILTDRKSFYAAVVRLNPDDSTTNLGLVMQLTDE